MKIQINATGQIVDEPLNRAQRWINRGIAHVVKEEVKPAVAEVKTVEFKGLAERIEKLSPDELRGSENTLKVLGDLGKRIEWEKTESTLEELPEVTEVDLIEPIPERFTSFEDEPKVSKSTWKPKKKKSK